MSFKWVGMSEDGNTVTLKKFTGEISPPNYFNDDWISQNINHVKRGVVIDVETTGLDKKNDKVIEIGIRCFTFNELNGDVLTYDFAYNAFQDPGAPLSEEIKKLTGITDQMVKGQSIDWKYVGDILDATHLVIAHNASFDRPFIERYVSSSESKTWGCSYKQVDWSAKGFTVHKLDVLSIYHGFYVDAHRAQNDVDALLNLLNFKDEKGNAYLFELFQNANKTYVKVFAKNSPFESKDILKSRGYSWDSTQKTWYKTIDKDTLDYEISILESAVYRGPFRGQTFEISPSDNFK